MISPRPDARMPAPDIPVLRLDLSSKPPAWEEALRPVAPAGEELVGAFNQTVERVTGSIGRKVLRQAASYVSRLLGRQYGAEIDAIGRALNTDPDDILLANLAYDLSQMGCSTVAFPGVNGPVHARNLDWEFPRRLLARNAIVVRAENGARGPYKMVTWPGFFGALTGVARDRFSVTVNYVCHDEESNWRGVVTRAAKGFWPVSWVVRRAFDEAKDFAAAVRLLKGEVLLAPVLFMVVGTNDDERVVIERGCDTWEERRTPVERPLCLTNHYLTADFIDNNSDLGEMDTLE